MVLDFVTTELRAIKADKAISDKDEWVDVREHLDSMLERDDEDTKLVVPSGVPVDGVPDEDIPALVDYYRAKGMVG